MKERNTTALQGVSAENFFPSKGSPDTVGAIQFNDYTGTRDDFWRETFVVETLTVSMIYLNIQHSILKSSYFFRPFKTKHCQLKRLQHFWGSPTVCYTKSTENHLAK